MSETKVVVPSVLLELSRQGATGFRVNTGTGWVGNGKPVRITKPMTVTLRPGDVVLRGPVRPLNAGLVKGGSDIIGWDQVVITPDMVGKTIAQFLAIECKDGKGRLSDEQRIFINNVRAAGGKAGVAYCADDARDILKGHNISP